MSRTVLWLSALGGIVVVGAAGVAWRVMQSEPTAAPSVEARPVTAVAVAPVIPTAPAVPAERPPTTNPPAVPVPTFDVARIGPDGRAVIAGRAEPGAKVVLLDGGKEIAQSQADANGEWVILQQEPPLSPGQHELRVLQHVEGRAAATSEQVVVAVVPKPTGNTAGQGDTTLVMIAPPSGPAALVQAPAASGVPKAGDLAMSTLDYDDKGHVTITGQATAGAAVRAYVDDRMVAEGKADIDGKWRLAPTASIDPGKHTLRLDRLTKDGRPLARLELPFERTVVPPGGVEERRLVVVKGDNLWNIARAHYGEGTHHTLIFGANKEQIRDPNLIYPGQVLSLPKVN
jgi:nucleoid-associated protein YgaU